MSQISGQENQTKKYEVKILKQIEYLPNVFMIKHLNDEVTKISILAKYFENCTNYISRNKLTFSGCFKYLEHELLQTRGIYYTPVSPIFSVSKRSKITRSLEDMKNIILKEIELLNLRFKELLISYDNYSITIYDYYIKGQLYQFNLIYNQDYLEIYEVPPINDNLNLSFNHSNNLTIYHHEIKFSSPTLARDLYSDPGVAYLIHPENEVTLTLKSPTSSTDTVMLKANKYYLITHPKPRT
ncbi:MAG: hypothetical protein RXR31_08665 [Thermoproteota archaeon]